jgi:putative transcriptional regulator
LNGEPCAVSERLANRLKERRGEIGLTQAELAERCSVTRKTVNTVENGVFVPSTVLALKLARALNEPVETLFWLD